MASNKKEIPEELEKAGGNIPSSAQVSIVKDYMKEKDVDDLTDQERSKKKNDVRQLIIRGVTNKTLIAKTLGIARNTAASWYDEILIEFSEYTNSLDKKKEFGKTLNQIDKIISEMWSEIITQNMTGEDKIRALNVLLTPVMRRAELMGFTKDDTHLKSPLKEVQPHHTSNINVYNYFAALVNGKPEDIQKLKQLGVEVKQEDIGKVDINTLAGVRPI